MNLWVRPVKRATKGVQATWDEKSKSCLLMIYRIEGALEFQMPFLSIQLGIIINAEVATMAEHPNHCHWHPFLGLVFTTWIGKQRFLDSVAIPLGCAK